MICVALRDLLALVQFLKREKHPWRSVNFTKIIGCCMLTFKAPTPKNGPADSNLAVANDQ